MAKRAAQPNLYLQMESEREKIPQILRQDYIPIFIVNLLREKLCQDESKLERSNRTLAVELGLIPKDFKGSSSSPSENDKWTDDSIMADYVDFEESFLLTDESLAFTNRVLAFGKEAMITFNVDHGKFVKYFMEEIEFPTLELLWLIDCQYNLFSLSSYLMQLEHTHQIQFFRRQILSFCFSPAHFDIQFRDRSTAILEHIVQTLIISAYCNAGRSQTLQKLEALAKELLHQLTENLMNKSQENFSFINHQFTLTILQQANLPDSVKRRYFSHQLKQASLIADASTNPMSLNDVIKYQERFVNPAYLTENQSLGDTFAMMVGSPLTTADLLEVISASIRNPRRNWERTFRLITEWIQKIEYEATKAIKETIKDLMEEGLSLKIEEKVTLAFILARHCSLFAPKIFSRYEKWYSHMFESEVYSPAKDPDAFNFLANLLSQWIPFEPSCFLQVQATFWPYIPAGCKSTWSDYVSLAKVRVLEYNEVEGAMEFEPNPNNPVQYDVEMAIKGYESTRNMPQRVARMWMFNKQYYLDQFLPVLLKKPLAPALSDARLRLIEVLNKDGKIPAEMYAAYKNSSGS